MILYFSGTGNSEYIARRIAKATGDEILSLNERIRNGNAAAVRTGRPRLSRRPTAGASRALSKSG